MPFLGNVVDFIAGDPTEYINSLAEQYGHVFKVRYPTPSPRVPGS